MLLPDGLGDGFLEVADNIGILCQTSMRLNPKQQQDEKLTLELLLCATMILSISAFFVAAWSI